MRSKSVIRFAPVLGLLLAVAVLAVAGRSPAAGQASAIPDWLRAHVGEGEEQIAPIVLERARALYQSKVAAGVVKNPCYFAMDATRPNDLANGKPGLRFYVVCEAEQSFRAISAGHGSGRNLPGLADFANGRDCARNFGNALDSNLTAGGAYVTAEIKTSFKGYYRTSARGDAVLTRSFLQFDGEGATANARERKIGGHAAVVLHGVCMLKDPESPYADHQGYVPLGTRVEYPGGRSDGCTSWTPADADQIIAMTRDDPTTLYIYPDAADIDAVAHAVAARRSLASVGLYWNAACLSRIGAPRFWSNATVAPLIARYRRDHPPLPQRPTPICSR